MYYKWDMGSSSSKLRRSIALSLQIFLTSWMPVSNSWSSEFSNRLARPSRIASFLFSRAQITNGNPNLALYLENGKETPSFREKKILLDHLNKKVSWQIFLFATWLSTKERKEKKEGKEKFCNYKNSSAPRTNGRKFCLSVFFFFFLHMNSYKARRSFPHTIFFVIGHIYPCF